MIESAGSLMSPRPHLAQVVGRNCIGPCAPATDVPRIRPIAVSTRLIAARYSQPTPYAASAVL